MKPYRAALIEYILTIRKAESFGLDSASDLKFRKVIGYTRFYQKHTKGCWLH